MKIKVELLCWAVAAILAVALVGQYVAYRTAPITAYSHVSWAFHPASFADVANQASTIVEGEVTGVKAGPPLVVPAKGEPSGQDSIPTERITVRVTSSTKGTNSPGQELVVFRTGGQVQIPTGPAPNGPFDEHRGTELLPEPRGGKSDPNAPAPDRPANDGMKDAPATANVQILQVDGDPEYQVGQRVFLALEAGPDNTMRPVSPEGRYTVGGDGKLQAVSESAVAQSLNGRTLAEGQAAAQGLLTIPVNPSDQDTGAEKRETTAPGMPTTGEAALWFWLVLGGMALGLVALGLVLRRRQA